MINDRGFTLIELMVVITLIGFLGGIAVPLGSQWATNSRLATAQGELTQAIGRAKAVALKNHQVAFFDGARAAICITANNDLTVLESTATSAPDCSTAAGTPIWTASVNENVSITSDDIAVACLCYDRLGLQTTVGCGGCLSSPAIEITTGSKTQTLYAY